MANSKNTKQKRGLLSRKTSRVLIPVYYNTNEQTEEMAEIGLMGLSCDGSISKEYTFIADCIGEIMEKRKIRFPRTRQEIDLIFSRKNKSHKKNVQIIKKEEPRTNIKNDRMNTNVVSKVLSTCIIQ